MMPAYPSIMSTGGGPSNGSSNNSNYRNDHVFHPMVSCAPNGCSPRQALDLMVKGFSPNYRGNPDLERNRSALIPEEENCSVFITGLSPDLTTHLLLASIRNMGRIYATHINGPEPSRGHQTCAAKVVFFERVAAKRFFDRYQSTGFVVAGRPFYVGHVVWNRIRSGEVDVGGRKSRVLIISGPRSLVNERSLFSYFASKIEFQVDEVITAAVSAAAAMGTEERALVEFRFGSYRCQAESARMALSREFKQHGVYCEFGIFSPSLRFSLTPFFFFPFPFCSDRINRDQIKSVKRESPLTDGEKQKQAPTLAICCPGQTPRLDGGPILSGDPRRRCSRSRRHSSSCFFFCYFHAPGRSLPAWRGASTLQRLRTWDERTPCRVVHVLSGGLCAVPCVLLLFRAVHKKEKG